MDNLAHTLAGLALAEAGLRRAAPRATITLAIGANLPDIDALIHFVGDGLDALAFRRGWTHGVLAMLVLPLLLTACVWGWEAVVRRRAGASSEIGEVGARRLLIVAAIGIWSHPLLDLLNVYGVRLLMPFSDRWYYGDALFIIDPWMWLLLGGSVVFARRARGRSRVRAERAPRAAIAVLAAYAAAMAVVGSAGARRVANGADRVMAAPVAVTPFTRYVVRDLGDRYERGMLALGRSATYASLGELPSGRGTPVAAAAARTAEGGKFLSWSRFPRFVAQSSGDSVSVRISDMRYEDARGRGWASVVVTLPRAP